MKFSLPFHSTSAYKTLACCNLLACTRSSKVFRQSLLAVFSLLLVLAGGVNHSIWSEPVTPQPARVEISKPFDPASVKVAPIRSAGVVALDLPDSSAKTVSLDIIQGRFSDYSVGNIHLVGSGIDFKQGVLQKLEASIKEGNFDNLLVDQMTVTAPAFSFDTMQLLNNQTFVLKEPVDAVVQISISEAAINQFLANPKTISNIEKAVQKQTGGIKLVTFSNPSFQLLSGQKVKLAVTGLLGQGIPLPLAMDGNLKISAGGQLGITDLKVSSSGTSVQMPVNVADTFQQKLNELINFQRLGKNSMVITAEKLVTSGKTLKMTGHAKLTRLKFGS
jgi:hypothetical protein